MDLNTDWYDWLATNDARGVDYFDLYRDMVRAGFGHHHIVQALDRALSNRKRRNIQIECSSKYRPAVIDSGLPLIQIEGFLSTEQCNSVSDAAHHHLMESRLTGKTEVPEFRTNRTFHVNCNQTLALQLIDTQINELVGLSREYAEPMQVQVYDKGQQFQLHTDYFEDQYDTEQLLELGQRTISVLVFIEEPESGGETEFVDLCQVIVPQRGTALIWHNLHEDNSPNPRSCHCSRPIRRGRKVVITKWYRSLSESFGRLILPATATKSRHKSAHLPAQEPPATLSGAGAVKSRTQLDRITSYKECKNAWN